MPTLVQSIDPRAGTLQPAPEGLEYRVAVPLWGPYYQMSPWTWSDTPQSSFYDPRTYPFPAVNPFLPQRSGAYIQPGQMDPLAYKLVNEGGLDGFGQVDQSKTIKIAVGTWIAFAIGRAALQALVPQRKIRRALRGVPKKAWGVLGVLAAAGATWWYITQKPDLQVSLLGRLGQIADRDWFPEDPTGGGYAGAGDPVYGDVLGPGESIAVAENWIANLHPRGFSS